MIVDTSALIAVLRDEPDAEVYAPSPSPQPTPTDLSGESPRGPRSSSPPTRSLLRAPRTATRPSSTSGLLRLCPRQDHGQPLLFKGDGFRRTDILAATGMQGNVSD
ncbi:MAG: hypothetical protein ACRDTT_31370 [Pseudonocardiaceae bacterium]